MTHLLKQAFAKAAELPEVEQNVVARWMLGELSSERRWENLFAESEGVLSKLAQEALKEHKQRKTKPLRLKRS